MSFKFSIRCTGIPDFRGPDGNWTLRAQGRPRTEHANTLQAIPTPSHMALVELQNRGILKYLVSQNCDGLHRRSGILPVRCGARSPMMLTDILQERISELHGNSNRESCYDCGKEYIRGNQEFLLIALYHRSSGWHRFSRRLNL